jgi:hypothetical protein
MKYHLGEASEFDFRFLPNPACYDAMAQLAAGSRLRNYPKLQDTAWLERYLTWTSTAAMLMMRGPELSGFMLLKHDSPGNRFLTVDAAVVSHSGNEEVAYANLSSGLYAWLWEPKLQFASIGPRAVPAFPKAIIKIPEHSHREDHERLWRIGWRPCGTFVEGWTVFREHHLHINYGLDLGQVLAAARQFSLTGS